MSTLSVCTSFPNKLWMVGQTHHDGAKTQRPQNYRVELTEEKSHPQPHPTPKLVSTEHQAAQQVLPWGLAPLPHAGGQAKGQRGAGTSLRALVGNQPRVLWGQRWSQAAWRRQSWGFSAGGHTTYAQVHRGDCPCLNPIFPAADKAEGTREPRGYSSNGLFKDQTPLCYTLLFVNSSSWAKRW